MNAPETIRRPPSYGVGDDEKRAAVVPHEIFLTNLIGNHILVFIATLGFASHDIEPVLAVPAISFCLLGYTLWRARRARRRDGWYVMVHWQVAGRFSRIFIAMLCVLLAAAALAWFGHEALGVRKVAALAFVGGVGLLPTLVTVLVLIVIESDALQQARHGRVPRWAVRRYPHPEGVEPA